METVLSKDIQAGLDAARIDAMKRSSRLRIVLNGASHKILRMWKSGFAMAAEDTPALRGFVDIYDGSVHLFQCLIVAGAQDGGEMQYEFKRATAITDRPALDFEREANAPIALIARDDAAL
jgi:hypothetical protein